MAVLAFSILMLLTLGGVLDPILKRRADRWILVVAFSALAALSTVEIHFIAVVNLGACFSFALLFIFVPNREGWWRIPLCSLLCGMLAWKLCDRFPLFFELGLLGALPSIVLALMCCRGLANRLLVVLSAPVIARLIMSIADYVLFDFAIVNIGGDWAVCAQALGCAAILIAQTVQQWLFALRCSKHIVLPNQ